MKLKFFNVIISLPFLLGFITCTFEEEVESCQIPTYGSFVSRVSSMSDHNPQKKKLEIKKKQLDDFKEFFGDSIKSMMNEKFTSVSDLKKKTPIEIQASVKPMFGQMERIIKIKTLINEWLMTVDKKHDYFQEFYGTFDISEFYEEKNGSNTKKILMMTEDSDLSIDEFIQSEKTDPESTNGIQLFLNLALGLKIFHKKFYMCLLGYDNIVFKDVTALGLKDNKSRFIIKSNEKNYTVKFGHYNFATSVTGPDCDSNESPYLPLDVNARSQKNLCDLTGLVVWVLDLEFALAGLPHSYSSLRGLAFQLCKGAKENNESMIEQMTERLNDFELIQKARLYGKHELLTPRFESVPGMKFFAWNIDIIDTIKNHPQHIDSIMMHIFLEHVYQTNNMKDLPEKSKMGLKQSWNQMLFELLITNFEGQTNLKKLIGKALKFKNKIRDVKNLRRNLKLNGIEIKDGKKEIEQNKEASANGELSTDRLSENNKNSDLTPVKNKSEIMNKRLVIV
jgi:hypothetical protein